MEGPRRHADPADAVGYTDTRGGEFPLDRRHGWAHGRSYRMHRVIVGVLLLSSAGCALPRAAGAPLAPLAPVERAWEVPTLELYSEWWRKTEACSGRKGDMSQVKFYAVDAPNGAIGLNGTLAHGWWVRQGNRIYLPANGLGEEWLVRHEMLHALLQRGSHPTKKFVEACHLASLDVWRDSTMRVDPGNPRGR
jgi:hypothetical protein